MDRQTDKQHGNTPPERILVTGAAGFIGSAVAARLAALGHQVSGCDNFNDYYDPQLKRDRVAALLTPAGVVCEHVELADPLQMARLFARAEPTRVVHLAAQAGVRYSLDNPAAYVQSNLVAFANLLEACRAMPPRHLVYASSSSVYGNDGAGPCREDDAADRPVSFYAATKRANELMAHSYSQLYRLPASAVRLFTVYGPWGRPDMAYYAFARDILDGVPIQVYGQGRLRRDFTYIDDVVEAVLRVLFTPPPATQPHAILNIGNDAPVALLEFIATLERHLGRAAQLVMAPMQPGDVAATWADTRRLRESIGFAPATALDAGLKKFVDWYTEYR
jgi:UDP-glucuronate 4-epimerase